MSIKSKHPGPEREDCKHQRSSMEQRGKKLSKGRNSKHSAEASKISQCHQTTHRDIFLERHPCGLRLAWVAFLRLVSKRQQGHLIAGGTNFRTEGMPIKLNSPSGWSAIGNPAVLDRGQAGPVPVTNPAWPACERVLSEQLCASKHLQLWLGPWRMHTTAEKDRRRLGLVPDRTWLGLQNPARCSRAPLLGRSDGQHTWWQHH